MRHPLTRTLLTIATLALVPAAVTAAPGASASLAELRVQVDTVAEAVEAARATARDELATLRAERAELERQVRAQKARAATLKRLQIEATARTEELDAEDRRWHDPTLAAIAAARVHVERTLPFARAARAAVLDRIERDLGAAVPDHARAVERLLRFIEEEEAMGSEIALTQQTLELEGEPRLVDVVRLGMALLYYRTAEDTYGWARPSAHGWTVERVSDEAAIDVLRRRFDAHENNDALGPAELLVPSDPPQVSAG